MTHSEIPLSQTLVALFKAKNIKHIVLSPGSRNAPLTIGFTFDPYFKCYSIVDERCAGFFAMGIAQQINEPVAVVCTSGSALLNYFPAVSEAFYSNIPLIVLSADRPEHLIGIGDGQTINQKNVYGDHVLYSANLKLDINAEKEAKQQSDLSILKNSENKLEHFLDLKQSVQSYNEAQINEAINIAITKKGPVHINSPFDEPLYNRVEAPSVSPKAIMPIKEQQDLSDLPQYISTWQQAKRKLILVGVLAPNSIERKYIDLLAQDESVLILTETTSNLHHPNVISGIDKLIATFNDTDFKALQPEVLLTFGGLVVSKKIKAFLRNYKPISHWHIGETKANDTFFVLNKVFNMPINAFLSVFTANYIKNTSGYNQSFLELKKSRDVKHIDYINKIGFSDFKAFHYILNAIPNNYQFQVGNSSAIRYTQLFNLDRSLKVFCNRGTSGIDGSTTTAIGAAITEANPTLFVTGDLSFFYDSNALWNNYIPSNFKIIVINNAGGGIFRILPGHKNTDNFDTFFETKHNLNAEHLCNMYGLKYTSAKTEKDLEKALPEFFNSNTAPQLLEVFTPSRDNDEILLNYFKFIS